MEQLKISYNLFSHWTKRNQKEYIKFNTRQYYDQVAIWKKISTINNEKFHRFQSYSIIEVLHMCIIEKIQNKTIILNKSITSIKEKKIKTFN